MSELDLVRGKVAARLKTFGCWPASVAARIAVSAGLGPTLNPFETTSIQGSTLCGKDRKHVHGRRSDQNWIRGGHAEYQFRAQYGTGYCQEKVRGQTGGGHLEPQSSSRLSYFYTLDTYMNTRERCDTRTRTQC